MLVHAYAAGVLSLDWLLLDDIMDMDHQRVALHGLISQTFSLLRGTAQGRRFSIPLFNAMLRELADGVRRVASPSCSAWLPSFAVRALALAEDAVPSLLGAVAQVSCVHLGW